MRRLHAFRAHAGDDQVLPDREPNVAVAEVACDLREPSYLTGGHLADREDDADPISVGLLLRMHADMGGAVEPRSGRERITDNAIEFAAEFFLDQPQHFVEAEAVDDVFEPRLGAVGAVAVIDEYAHDGVGHLGGVGGFDHHAGLAREVPVPGDAADHQAKPHAGHDLAALLHLDRLEADVVGILKHGNDAAAVEADIELARQAVERAFVEDVEMPFARVGPGVDQLLGIDARGGRARDVANIVGARAARAQPEILHRLDGGDGVLGFDLAHLEVGAGGDVGIAAAVALGEIGDAGKLPVRENAVRHAQSAHIGVLIGRHVEQPEEAPAEIVRRFGIFVVRRLRLEAFVAVEGVEFALEFLLLGELAAGGEHAILGAHMRGVGSARLRRFRSRSSGSADARARGLGDLQAGDEAFEVTLLLGVEIARHGVAFGFFFEQRACRSSARTAPVGPACCRAAKTVPSRLPLISLGIFCSAASCRRPPGRPLPITSKFYAASILRAAGADGGRFCDYGCPADAVRPRRPAPYRRCWSFVASPLSAGMKIFCSTCRCTGFFTIGT